jgi:hypothetical protein
MTRWTCRALGLLALTAGLALAQPPKKEPAPKEPPKPAAGSLEDTLDKALRNSADIKVAEAKVRDAEAELNRVRQQVLMKATTLHNDLRLAKRMLDVMEANYASAQEAYKKSITPANAVDAARLEFEKQKAVVERAEAELKALRGEFAIRAGSGVSVLTFSPDGQLLADLTAGRVRLWDAASGKALPEIDGKPVWDFTGTGPKSNVQPSMAERVLKWMDQEVELKADEENLMRLEDLMDHLGKKTKEMVPVRMSKAAADFAYKNAFRGGKVQVGALIQSVHDSAIEDGDGLDVAIVVRDYGLLITTKDRVPEGAVRAIDLWKSKNEKKPEPAKP